MTRNLCEKKEFYIVEGQKEIAFFVLIFLYLKDVFSIFKRCNMFSGESNFRLKLIIIRRRNCNKRRWGEDAFGLMRILLVIRVSID